MPAPHTQDDFATLIDEHRGILYKVCNAYCRDRDARDDLAQEILVQLWRSFPRFDGRSRFSTWMYRIALNAAISFFRSERARTRLVVSGEQLLQEVADKAELPDEVGLLYRFIETLDPLNKALVLLYLDGNSHAEIGRIMGITETNVSTRINRLKNRMKEEIGHGA